MREGGQRFLGGEQVGLPDISATALCITRFRSLARMAITLILATAF